MILEFCSVRLSPLTFRLSAAIQKNEVPTTVDPRIKLTGALEQIVVSPHNDPLTTDHKTGVGFTVTVTVWGAPTQPLNDVVTV
jgi:hypothetical protein